MYDLEATGVPPRVSPADRVRQWLKRLQSDAQTDDDEMEERRRRLLHCLNEEVASAPDDVPIKHVISRLNRHWDD